MTYLHIEWSHLRFQESHITVGTKPHYLIEHTLAKAPCYITLSIIPWGLFSPKNLTIKCMNTLCQAQLQVTKHILVPALCYIFREGSFLGIKKKRHDSQLTRYLYFLIRPVPFLRKHECFNRKPLFSVSKNGERSCERRI